MEGVYNKAKSEEVAPGMRSAISPACALLSAEALVQGLDHDSSLADKRVVGSEWGACTRAWFHQFCSVEEYLVPSVVPIRENFTNIFGRRVRAWTLTDA